MSEIQNNKLNRRIKVKKISQKTKQKYDIYSCIHTHTHIHKHTHIHTYMHGKDDDSLRILVLEGQYLNNRYSNKIKK